jgi:hypothetical protein
MSTIKQADSRPRCNRCEFPLREGEFLLCADCAEEEDREIEERTHEQEKRPYCGCPYCFCLTKTEYGEPCESCLMGAHQG